MGYGVHMSNLIDTAIQWYQFVAGTGALFGSLALATILYTDRQGALPDVVERP